MRAARLLVFVVMAAVLAGISGCTPWATFPPIEGVAEFNSPKLYPIPALMADSVAFCHERYAPERELVVNLPAGTPAEVYDDVLGRLGEGARVMTEADAAAFHVLVVRVRADQAEVDVIYPRDDDNEMVTLYFIKPFAKPYRVDYTRLWRIRVDVPGPTYVSPAEPEAAVETEPEAEPAAPEAPVESTPAESTPAADAPAATE